MVVNATTEPSEYFCANKADSVIRCKSCQYLEQEQQESHKRYLCLAKIIGGLPLKDCFRKILCELWNTQADYAF